MTCTRFVVTTLVACLLAGSGTAEVTTREETRAGRKLMVLENERIRLGVLPDPGGTVIEFIDKQTGVNFVAGGDKVLEGKLGWGWKDYYWLEELAQLGKGVFALPYKGEFRAGPGLQVHFRQL